MGELGESLPEALGGVPKLLPAALRGPQGHSQHLSATQTRTRCHVVLVGARDPTQVLASATGPQISSLQFCQTSHET